MSATDALCEDLGKLRRAAGVRPVDALAVVLEDDPDHAVCVVANAVGVAAYRGPRTTYPAGVLPSAEAADGPRDLDLASHPDGFFERRLLLTGFPDDLQ